MKNENVVITYIIGNGFDMAVLEALGQEYSTSYEEFYNYLSFFLKNKDKNSIYKKILESKNKNDKLWTDYELLLQDLVHQKISEIGQVENQNQKKDIYEDFMKDWEEIQYKFSDFLNYVITPDTLKKVSNMAGINSLERCLGELSFEDWKSLRFRLLPCHECKLTYNILNFNYSTLADNYFFHLRDPHPFNEATNNSYFYPNPKGYNLENYYYNNSTRRISLVSEVKFYHPHGQLSIPSSILFGISINKSKYRTSKAENSHLHNNYGEDILKKMDKLYWSDSKEEVQKEISNTNLFIFFGHSIGESDKWWWKQILEQLMLSDSEIIIYDFKSNNLKEKLINYFPEQRDTINDRIYTVNFNNSDSLLKIAFNFENSQNSNASK